MQDASNILQAYWQTEFAHVNDLLDSLNLERWKETVIASVVLSVITLRFTSCFDGICASGILKQIYAIILFGGTVFICAGILTFSSYEVP